jgi:hypothetical protein
MPSRHCSRSGSCSVNSHLFPIYRAFRCTYFGLRRRFLERFSCCVNYRSTLTWQGSQIQSLYRPPKNKASSSYPRFPATLKILGEQLVRNSVSHHSHRLTLAFSLLACASLTACGGGIGPDAEAAAPPAIAAAAYDGMDAEQHQRRRRPSDDRVLGLKRRSSNVGPT